ncbi:MAG: ABC transporter ATP-binding protein [Candidatus Thorarchaeota archaeon]
MSKTLLKVKNLKTYFPIKAGVLRRNIGWIRAVDDISFDIDKGEILGLVGESGCGKTTVGRVILMLEKATSGEIWFNGKELTKMRKSKLRQQRRQMMMVFQDPFSSLNPRMTVKRIVGEPLLINRYCAKHEIKNRVIELLKNVGLKEEHLDRYPHEFSGGQRQRICVARALALNPSLIVLDEPTSALDVSVQSQVLNLFKKLLSEFGLSYLFISHDLAVIEYMSDKICVMYVGKIVEQGHTKNVYENPAHPYTKALMSAILEPNPEVKREMIILKGDVPSPANPPSGCRFHPRCWLAKPICSTEEPSFTDLGNKHFAACWALENSYT